MRLPDLESLHARWMTDIVHRCELCGGLGVVGTPEAPRKCACARAVSRLATVAYGNLPREFWYAEDGTYDGPSASFIERLRNWPLRRARAEGQSALLLGECGVGKTTAAAIVLSRAARRGYTVGYVTAPDFVRTEIPDPREHEDFREWREDLLGADFLVLDELGKEHRKEGSDYATVLIEMLLRRRRGDLKPTVVVTNMELATFKRVYGESIWSILSDRCMKLQFPPGDRRGGG